MKEKKVIHKIWIEAAHEVLGHKLVGKYQYLFSDKGNTISMVQLYGYPLSLKKSYNDTWKHFQWEIYQVDGKDNLFEDVERYNTEKQARKRIKELLKNDG